MAIRKKARKASSYKPDVIHNPPRGRIDSHGNTIMPDDPRYMLKVDSQGRVSHELAPGQKAKEARHLRWRKTKPYMPPQDAPMTESPHYRGMQLGIIPADFFEGTPAERMASEFIKILNKVLTEKQQLAMEYETMLSEEHARYVELTGYFYTDAVEDKRGEIVKQQRARRGNYENGADQKIGGWEMRIVTPPSDTRPWWRRIWG